MIRTSKVLQVLVDSYFRWKATNPDRCWHIRELADDLRIGEKLQEQLTERALELNDEDRDHRK